ncbi:helix-turn-helix domain-containing protein [Piscinibacter sakaiensis]|uniref:helix-turn-helix domain-containing protein n=1 Tax=Piscinibacter sakaiensis TaxID=1547922 RepID=UPI003AAA36E6
MNEFDAATPTDTAKGGAGRLLREAREAQGMSIDMLATSMKVSVRKLEMLEAERFDELPDATFARALAQAVCRALKIDAAPVLAKLPPPSGHRIELVSEGLNEPFRDHPSRLDPLAWAATLKAAWAPALVLALAALVFFLPGSLLESTKSLIADVTGAIRGTGQPADQDTVIETIHPSIDLIAQSGQAPAAAASQPTPTAEPGAAAPAASAAPLSVAPSTTAPPPGVLELHATAESWIEVKDGRDRVLLSRSLRPDETVQLDGVMPMRVKIGNAAATRLRYRGELIDLAPMTNENIARVLLK